jgi:hypothetical protein
MRWPMSDNPLIRTYSMFNEFILRDIPKSMIILYQEMLETMVISAIFHKRNVIQRKGILRSYLIDDSGLPALVEEVV